MLEIQKKDLGEDALAVAVTLHYIGNMLTLERNINKALEKLERALEIQMK